jgi:Ca2+-binding RTX toxin-like protein
MSLTFDATFYQSHRPDVYNAFVATAGSTGLTWAQFAEQHYDTFGRFEGSDPSASFNTSFYLSTYPDVAAAGINPFTHFLQFGSAEDRQPFVNFPNIANGQFVPATYAAANPDLAAAGITSDAALYQHFVVFGQFEGRSGAPTVNTPGSGTGQTFVFTTTVGESFVGTDENDVFSATADAAGLGATAPGVPATLNPTDSADGGAGTDTINIISTSALAPIGASLSNIEIVNLISDIPANTFAAGTANAANFSGVTQLWQIGGTASQAVTGLTDSITAGFNGTVANNIVGATGLTTANVALNNVATSTLTVDEAVGTTTSVLTTINVNGSMAAASTLTIDADTGGAGVAPTAETTVNLGLTGNATTVILTSATTTTIDAGSSTAGITMAATPAAVTTYVGGSGVDNITGGAAVTSMTGAAGNDVLNAAASTGAVTLDGGAGNDILTSGTVGSTVTGGTGRDQMTAGGGVDTFIINAGDSTLTFATIDLITGFKVAGADKLDFNLTAGTAANFLADASAAGFVDALSNANTAFNGTVQYFLSTGIADVDSGAPVTAGELLFVDSDLDGTADFSVALAGVTGMVFGDIIA